MLPWSWHIPMIKLKWNVTCSSIYATIDGKFHHQTFSQPVFLVIWFWEWTHKIQSYWLPWPISIGRLCSRPVSLLFASLLVTQVPHILQYNSRSCDIDCHQKYLLMYWDVLNCPKWPIMLCAWSMIILINRFPLWIALGDTHITSHDRLFIIKINPSFTPNFACAFGFSNILE